MKMLKRLFSQSWLSLSWRHQETPKPAAIPQALIPPEEFARLIGSGRVEDLRILAKKLSGQSKAHA
jgi:hypothetical protein